jgi:parallel beta-helix repeat protein
VIFVQSSSYSRIEGNDVAGTDGCPICLRSSNHDRVAGNTLTNDFEGTSLVGSNDNVVADNLGRPEGAITGFPSFGVLLATSSGNSMLRNAFVGKRVGLWLKSGSNNVLRRNSALSGLPADFSPEVEPDGIRVEAAATGALLQGNTASGNPDDGFDVEAPGTQLRRNTAKDNGDLGFEAVPGIIDLGGNRASWNGNPLQCLNVVCR